LDIDGFDGMKPDAQWSSYCTKVLIDTFVWLDPCGLAAGLRF
jgi:hypothetical protein